MIKLENGVYREMTEDEVAEMGIEQSTETAPSTDSDPLTEMASAMSTATTLAQMRAAAKAFLTSTGGDEI